MIKFVRKCCIHQIWKIVVIAIFAFKNFIIWKIIVIVIFASNILSFFSISNQSALKIWKSFSWIIQKKHDLITQLFVVFNIENLISYHSRFPIWWLTTNWMTMKFEFESIYIFLFFIFLFRISKSLDAISLHISNFEIFFTFTIFNAQLNQTIISENNFDTIQFFMRRKFLTINNIELMILFFDQLFQQKNCIYLTSNTSFVCQFADIVLFRIFRMKFS